MSRKIRVCHISSVHYSLDTRILHRECVSLAQHGYEVHFLVLNQESQTVKGVQIHSLNTPISNRLDRMRRAPKLLFNKAMELDARIYHFHDPELLPLGRKLQAAGKKVIYDSHEHVPHQIRTKKYLPAILRLPIAWIFEQYENRMVAKMDAVVTATDLVRDRFLAINPRVIEVNNYPRLDTFLLPKSTGVEKKYDVTYVGLISEIRGIRQLLDSLIPGDTWRLCLVGYFETQTLENAIRQHPQWQRVDFVGRKSREEVAEILSQSNIGIVTFLPAPNHTKNQPNKLFEYMAASLPVICSDFERWRNIVEQAQCGLCVNPADPAAIREAVQTLLADPDRLAVLGKNARRAMEDSFNWGSEEARLLGLYTTLLQG
ncbi:MAG: glycosyltransferase family 4 protein [Saprospiraceae bacterium]|nr:glycosyltransferase family 4 protein [Saprospiraceae bacterium]